jgi:hypothetical protein
MSFPSFDKYSGSSSGSTTVTYPVPDISTMRRRRQSDANYQFNLRVREMEKIRDARRRMVTQPKDQPPNTTSQINSCDMTGKEFQIVCEELWIDFKSWVNHDENFSDCLSKVCNAISRNWVSIYFTALFLLWFRWYIGTGKDACSFGFGYGIFSFVCEILRQMSNVVIIILLTFTIICVALAPIVVCVCIYEFNDAFPRPHTDDTEDDAEDDAEDDDAEDDAEDDDTEDDADVDENPFID